MEFQLHSLQGSRRSHWFPVGDSQIQLLSAARVAQYFTSLALGKTGWVSVGTDRDAS